MANPAPGTAQLVYTYNSNNKLYSNLYITSVTHSGTTVTVSGKVTFYNGGTTGYSCYFNNGVGCNINGDGWDLIVGKSVNIKAGGTTFEKSFTTYIYNVPASSTTADIGISYRACNANNCSTTYFNTTKYWQLSFASSVSAPSSLGCTVNSVTWNSVNGTFSVGNWGGEPTGSSKYIAGRLFGSSGNARREEQASNTNSITRNITTNSVALDGGITVKGAGSYRIDTYASNSAGSATTSLQNVYTPPSPLSSITYTQTQGSTNVTINATITGGSSTDNYGNTVTTYWRYSTNGGSSWSGWGNAGTGTPWTAKSVSFTCAYGASVKIEAYQSYQSKDSAHKTVSFTATNGTAPSGGISRITSSTWNSVTLEATGVDYGKPDGISGRKISIGVSGSPSNLNNKRENQVENVTSATTTVTNSSGYSGASALDLKGMLAVYPYLWAWNTISSTTVFHDTTPYYLPPAPGQFSYELAYETTTSKVYNVYFAGVVANNISDYTGPDLSMIMEMWDDGLNDWIVVDSMDGVQLDASRLFYHLTLGPQTSARFRGKLTYKNKDSEYVYLMLTNSSDPVKLYGGVSERDPQTGVITDLGAKEVIHLYGSLNDETKKIVKLYGSHQGVSRLVFEDV